MKNKKTIKNILILTLFLFILIKLVYAGATYPVPSEIQLKPGENSRFKFIVTSSGASELECIISPDLLVPFEIIFDETEFIIPEGETSKPVTGTVYVSEGTTTGKYQETFSVTCKPILEEGSEGSTVSTTTKGLPINIDVVKERTKENMNIPTEQKPLQVPVYFYYVLIIIIILIALYIIYKKRKT